MLEKKYKANEIEKELVDFWKNNEIFKYEETSNKELYSIDTPPPTVSGKLHIGHIFSYTQAEMIARYKRAIGYNVFYPFGFDDNGLPTERLVENDLKIKAKEMPRSKFNQNCLNVIKNYEAEFKNLWTNLGFSCDWGLEYKTVSPLSQKISQRSFIDLYNKKKAYIEESPVLYCTHCQTSIAQAELETKELESHFNYIKFYIDDEYLMVATTRPELLNSCQAIFIHPDDDKNSHYIGKTAIVPLYNYEVPILPNEDVDKEKGSGAVMFCTFGDTKDLEWYKEYDYPYKKTINTDGFIDESVEFIGGMHVKKARKSIIELLKENELLIKSTSITHPVSVHERCSNEVEIIPSQQWYIDILSSQDELIKLADQINWYPSYMKSRYLSWVENLKWNWCISRQRYFGVPFPVWYCEDCGEIKIAEESELPINPLETNPMTPCKCGSTNFVPESAVLDTWATSSVSPLINSKWGEENDITNKLLPMGMRTQAHEIIRTWAFYTIAKTHFHLNMIPWKDIMICGFVLARKGEKISKSKKNSNLEPNKLIENHSADGIRYWAASAKLGTDTTFSEEDLKISKRFTTKLWNASKFSLMHLDDYDGSISTVILPQDKWIIERVKETTNRAKKYLDEYEIGLARNIIDDFFWKDYCDNYLELVKDRLYKPEIHGAEERKSGQYALYQSLLNILKLYSIFTPFITEKIYKSFFEKFEKENSITKLLWSDSKENHRYITFGNSLKTILSVARKYKTEKALSMKAEISKLNLTIPSEQKSFIELTLKDIETTTHALEINLNEGTECSVVVE
ncbi:valine--tRNA ligase [Clostridiaceae bacterium M8S5]|nr:valine--tRNA ligase [Clostridiaceae bacterium M8S5]